MIRITKEELEEYYLIQGHSFQETREHFKVGKKYLNKYLNEYKLFKNSKSNLEPENNIEKPLEPIISYRISIS